MLVENLIIAAAAAHFMDFLDTGTLRHIPESVLAAGQLLADLGLAIDEDGVVQASPDNERTNEAIFVAFMLGGTQRGVS